MSLLLLVVLATALTNAQTSAECQQIFTDKASEIASAGRDIVSSCATITSECSSSCSSALESYKNLIGCCLASFSGGEAYSTFYGLCNITAPMACSSSGANSNSASGVFTILSTVGLVSIFSYVMN